MSHTKSIVIKPAHLSPERIPSIRIKSLKPRSFINRNLTTRGWIEADHTHTATRANNETIVMTRGGNIEGMKYA